MKKLIAADALALAVWLAMAVLVVLFQDVTLHGPDQIRDMEVARAMVQAGQWPVDGPSLFGARFALPPGFYYLLAAPLWLHNDEVAVFIAFGLAFMASVLLVWWQVRRLWGAGVALGYMLLAFPLFPVLYVHSAWNPALTMTFSNLVLGLWLPVLAQQGQRWSALMLAFFVLLQVHPSGLPLGLGLGLWVLLHPAGWRRPGNWLTLLGIAGLTLWWLAGSAMWARLDWTELGGFTTGEGGSRWANLLDGAKWRDVLWMPYRAVAGIDLPLIWPRWASALHNGVVLLGVLLTVAGLLWRRQGRAVAAWVLCAVLGWFLVAMLFLNQGAFWHVDVIYPWLAVLAAWGWGQLGQWGRVWQGGRIGWGQAGTVGVLGVMLVLAHGTFYQALQRVGVFELRLSAMLFPAAAGGEGRLPAYTYRHLRQWQDFFTEHGVCAEQVVGMEWLRMRELGRRAFDPVCAGKPGPEAALYWLVHSTQVVESAPASEGQAARQPLMQIGSTQVYRLPPDGLLMNDQPTHNLVAETRLSYMTYQPAQSLDGLRLRWPAPSDQAAQVLRVALRCAPDAQINLADMPSAVSWRLHNARVLQPPQWHKTELLGWVFYDGVWQISGQDTGVGIGNASGLMAELAYPQLGLACDVSAFASPAPFPVGNPANK